MAFIGCYFGENLNIQLGVKPPPSPKYIYCKRIETYYARTVYLSSKKVNSKVMAIHIYERENSVIGDILVLFHSLSFLNDVNCCI